MFAVVVRVGVLEDASQGGDQRREIGGRRWREGAIFVGFALGCHEGIVSGGAGLVNGGLLLR